MQKSNGLCCSSNLGPTKIPSVEVSIDFRIATLEFGKKNTKQSKNACCLIFSQSVDQILKRLKIEWYFQQHQYGQNTASEIIMTDQWKSIASNKGRKDIRISLNLAYKIFEICVEMKKIPLIKYFTIGQNNSFKWHETPFIQAIAIRWIVLVVI